MPPGTFGGNMDVRQLTRGTTLYLPVFAEGDNPVGSAASVRLLCG